LDHFLNETPRQILSLMQFVEAASLEDARNQAHKIKGASAAVGGEALRALASKLETAAKEGDLAAVTTLASDLDVQFLRLREAIALNRAA
jgi:HPt (histidine-containing phosphotransfer) domain-containing protein